MVLKLIFSFLNKHCQSSSNEFQMRQSIYNLSVSQFSMKRNVKKAIYDF